MVSACLLILQGCSVVEYDPANAPKMIVTDEHTAFYRHGPAQSSGPDFSLNKGETVEVLRREFGYSVVRVHGEDNGYVANEALAPVNEPSPTPSPVHVKKRPKVGSSTSGSTSPAFRY
jgi:uncharacterized protein YgiM (DUF1202 family)